MSAQATDKLFFALFVWGVFGFLALVFQSDVLDSAGTLIFALLLVRVVFHEDKSDGEHELRGKVKVCAKSRWIINHGEGFGYAYIDSNNNVVHGHCVEYGDAVDSIPEDAMINAVYGVEDSYPVCAWDISWGTSELEQKPRFYDDTKDGAE